MYLNVNYGCLHLLHGEERIPRSVSFRRILYLTWSIRYEWLQTTDTTALPLFQLTATLTMDVMCNVVRAVLCAVLCAVRRMAGYNALVQIHRTHSCTLPLRRWVNISLYRVEYQWDENSCLHVMWNVCTTSDLFYFIFINIFFTAIFIYSVLIRSFTNVLNTPYRNQIQVDCMLNNLIIQCNKCKKRIDARDLLTGNGKGKRAILIRAYQSSISQSVNQSITQSLSQSSNQSSNQSSSSVSIVNCNLMKSISRRIICDIQGGIRNTNRNVKIKKKTPKEQKYDRSTSKTKELPSPYSAKQYGSCECQK